MKKLCKTTAIIAIIFTIALTCMTGCGEKTPTITESPISNPTQAPISTESPVEEYTVNFVGGDGAIGSAPNALILEAGESFIIPSNTFEKTGHIFNGFWTGWEYVFPGDSYTMKSQDITLTAQWIAKKSSGGGGGGGGGSSSTGGSSSSGSGNNQNQKETLVAPIIKVENGKVSWQAVSNANSYNIKIDNITKTITQTSYIPQGEGVKVLSVQAVSQDTSKYDNSTFSLKISVANNLNNSTNAISTDKLYILDNKQTTGDVILTSTTEKKNLYIEKGSDYAEINIDGKLSINIDHVEQNVPITATTIDLKVSNTTFVQNSPISSSNKITLSEGVLQNKNKIHATVDLCGTNSKIIYAKDNKEPIPPLVISNDNATISLEKPADIQLELNSNVSKIKIISDGDSTIAIRNSTVNSIAIESENNVVITNDSNKNLDVSINSKKAESITIGATKIVSETQNDDIKIDELCEIPDMKYENETLYWHDGDIEVSKTKDGNNYRYQTLLQNNNIEINFTIIPNQGTVKYRLKGAYIDKNNNLEKANISVKFPTTTYQLSLTQLTTTVVVTPKTYDKTKVIPFENISVKINEDGIPNDVISYCASYKNASAGDAKLCVKYTLNDKYANTYKAPIDEEIGTIINKVQLTTENTTVENKIYDGTNYIPVTPGQVYGIIDGDDVKVNVLSSTSATKNAGKDIVATVEYTFEGEDINNYIIPNADTFKIEIYKRQLKIYRVPTISAIKINADISAQLDDGSLLTNNIDGDSINFEEFLYWGDAINDILPIKVEYVLYGNDSQNYAPPVYESNTKIQTIEQYDLTINSKSTMMTYMTLSQLKNIVSTYAEAGYQNAKTISQLMDFVNKIEEGAKNEITSDIINLLRYNSNVYEDSSVVRESTTLSVLSTDIVTYCDCMDDLDFNSFGNETICIFVECDEAVKIMQYDKEIELKEEISLANNEVHTIDNGLKITYSVPDGWENPNTQYYISECYFDDDTYCMQLKNPINKNVQNKQFIGWECSTNDGSELLAFIPTALLTDDAIREGEINLVAKFADELPYEQSGKFFEIDCSKYCDINVYMLVEDDCGNYTYFARIDESIATPKYDNYQIVAFTDIEDGKVYETATFFSDGINTDCMVHVADGMELFDKAGKFTITTKNFPEDKDIPEISDFSVRFYVDKNGVKEELKHNTILNIGDEIYVETNFKEKPFICDIFLVAENNGEWEEIDSIVQNGVLKVYEEFNYGYNQELSIVVQPRTGYSRIELSKGYMEKKIHFENPNIVDLTVINTNLGGITYFAYGYDYEYECDMWQVMNEECYTQFAKGSIVPMTDFYDERYTVTFRNGSEDGTIVDVYDGFEMVEDTTLYVHFDIIE